MLEKFSKNTIFDAHFHYFYCKSLGICDFPEGWSGISCAHSREEWELQEDFARKFGEGVEEIVDWGGSFAFQGGSVALQGRDLAHQPVGIPRNEDFSQKIYNPQNPPNHQKNTFLLAYGLHPQNVGNEPIKESADFLENLAENKKIIAIGEAGFDYFNDDFKSYKKEQEEIWNIQLDLALKYNLPLVVHCRKANEKLFEYSNKLSKLPEVLFHSFMGSPVEGKSLLRKGINGYFSFGKQIFNNNKKVIACVKELPVDRVLGETDAPYQFLQGEKYTRPGEIVKILAEIKRLQAL